MRQFLKLFLLAAVGLITVLSLPVLSQTETTEPVQLAQQGQDFYEAGNLDRAIRTWQQAAAAYEAKGNQNGSQENLINTATAQQALGIYPQSCQTLLDAFKVTDAQCGDLLEEAQEMESELVGNIQIDRENQQESLLAIKKIAAQPNSLNKATGLLRFGDYFRESGYPRVGATILEMSLDTASQIEEPRSKTAALLSLGNTERAIAKRKQEQFPPQTIAVGVIASQQSLGESSPQYSQAALSSDQLALQYYQQAVNESPSPINALKAELNQLSLLLDMQEFWQQATGEILNNSEQLGITDSSFLEQIVSGAAELQFQVAQDLEPQIAELTGSIETQLANVPTTRAGIYSRINFAQSLIRQQRNDENTVQILATALQQARQLNNVTAQAEALGYLGYLYEQEQQYPQARRLTESALQAVPATEYPEISYRWHSQLGRILTAQGERPQALAAYEASFNTIRALRSDLATTPVEPIFREYISLLLAQEPNREELSKARDVLESLQVVKLDNFFRDPCSEVAEEPVIIDTVDPQAAVIYPILLEDRLEVVLTLPGQPLQHYSTRDSDSTKTVDGRQVRETINNLRRRSLTNPGFAEALRGARGNEQRIQTVQSSQEETIQSEIIPLAADLYDWLIKPAEANLQASGVQTLVFVLDGVMRNIPMALLYDRNQEQYLIQKDYDVALSSGLQLTDPQPLQRQPIRVLAAGVTDGLPEYKLPPIPKVEDELKKIKSIFADSEILLNQEFTQETLQQKLQESDYPVVHLATHGQFGSTSDQTFILSGAKDDRLINVNQFDNLLRVRNLRQSQPIELLVLSACNTAQGDDQAILGLAGVAVRAGARSTIATLWGANDEATADLMGRFYDNLAENNTISKAKALRKAQLDLLNDPESEYRHPYYWAPFVLVGNWL